MWLLSRDRQQHFSDRERQDSERFYDRSLKSMPNMTGQPGTGHCKWIMEEVPRRTSLVLLAFACFVLCLIGVEAEGFLDYQGRAGIIPIVRWNLRPVIFGVDEIVWYEDRENRMGGFQKGGSCNNRFVLKPEVAIAGKHQMLVRIPLQ